MRTRSQKDTTTQAIPTTGKQHVAGGHQPSWRLAEFDRMELDELSNTYYVFLKWPDGEVTRHDKEEVYKNCPQQLAFFYVGLIELVDPE
ncbi:hypothetical protein ACKLNR_014496 [Fusarium oxysporum f. sp. zingiberi]